MFRNNTPSLVRIDVTYGKGSSSELVFRLFQSMFIFLGVTDEKFSKEQVYDLSCVIVSQYKTITISEVMLFVSRFKAGRYGRFYGDTSYALTITQAMNTFMEERNDFYEQIEREEKEHRIAEEKKKEHISFEEWKRRKEANGEQVNISMSVVEERGRELRVINPIETALESARNLVTNKYNLSMKSLLEMRKVFIAKNGMTPEEFIEKSEKGEL